MMERFFLSLKTEQSWQRDYANHAEARMNIADYIVGFYNSVRLHSKLGNLLPIPSSSNRQSNNLSLCPKKLDQHSTTLIFCVEYPLQALRWAICELLPECCWVFRGGMALAQEMLFYF